MRCSVTISMHSPTLCSGETAMTGELMTSPTVVWGEERPMRKTLRA